jgi:hypothetical protein
VETVNVRLSAGGREGESDECEGLGESVQLTLYGEGVFLT